MTTLDDIRSHLTGDDPELRHAVLRFAMVEGSDDESLAPRALTDASDGDLLVIASHLRVSREAALQANALLATADDEDSVDLLAAIVGRGPTSLLDELPDLENSRLRHRRTLEGESVEALLARLDVRADEPSVEEDRETADIAEELARRADLTDDVVIAGVAATAEPLTRTGEAFYMIAGLRRLTGAVPHLVEALFWEEDFAAMDAGSALAKIRDPESPKAIVAGFARHEEAPTTAAFDALGDIHVEGSEAALLELLDQQPQNSEWILAPLCLLFSREGVTRAIAEYEEAIESGEDTHHLMFIEELWVATRILGIEPPEALEEDVHMHRDMMDGLGADEDEEEYVDDDVLEGPKAGDTDADLWWDPDRPPATPFRRETPKVGRNEPCPCGSGKKYKKCHG